MGAQTIGAPLGRTAKIANLSSIPATSTTVVTVSGKPGRVSSIYMNTNSTSVTLNVIIDGTTYSLTDTTTGWIAMSDTNAVGIKSYVPNGTGVPPILLDMPFNNTLTINAINATAGGFINVQYEV